MTAMQLGNLAIGLAASGNADGAKAVLREAMDLGASQHEEGLAVEGLLVLAIAAAHEGAPERAVTLWAAATERLGGIEYTIGPELDAYVTDVLEPLRAHPEFELHWGRGSELSVDDALARGLEDSR